MTTRLFIARLVWQFDMVLDPRSANWMDQKATVVWARREPLLVKFKARDESAWLSLDMAVSARVNKGSDAR